MDSVMIPKWVCCGVDWANLKADIEGASGAYLATHQIKKCPVCGAPRPEAMPEMSEDERIALALLNALYSGQVVSLDLFTVTTQRQGLAALAKARELLLPERGEWAKEREQLKRELAQMDQNYACERSEREEAEERITELESQLAEEGIRTRDLELALAARPAPAPLDPETPEVESLKASLASSGWFDSGESALVAELLKNPPTASDDLRRIMQPNAPTPEGQDFPTPEDWVPISTVINGR
jgi:hypothetical protein